MFCLLQLNYVFLLINACEEETPSWMPWKRRNIQSDSWLSLIFNIQDGMFVPLFPNHHVLGRSYHQCSSGEIRMIQCIDEHGAYNYIYASYFYFTCNILLCCRIMRKWIYVVLAFNYSLIRFLFVPVSLMQ